MQVHEALLPLTQSAEGPGVDGALRGGRALGPINDPSALFTLLAALRDADCHVRRVAVWASGLVEGAGGRRAIAADAERPDRGRPQGAAANCLPYLAEVIPREITIGLLRHERGLERTLGVRLVSAGKIRLETTEETTSLYVAAQNWKPLVEMGPDGTSSSGGAGFPGNRDPGPGSERPGPHWRSRRPEPFILRLKGQGPQGAGRSLPGSQADDRPRLEDSCTMAGLFS